MNSATCNCRRKKSARKRSLARRLAQALSALLLVAAVALVVAAEWFVHHPKPWIDERLATWPRLTTATLLWVGTPSAELTDAFDWTGQDAVVTTTRKTPSDTVAFAGLPRRVGHPAPDDIKVLDRGEFAVGWSPSLRHPVWCAYHVTKTPLFSPEKRPPFRADKYAARSPLASDYSKTGYDRGHMVPNYAMASRFGPETQKKTFLMSNIAPQSPSLNRGVWREVEHRIADFWTAKWGEVWVVVGALSDEGATVGQTTIDCPRAFYQLVVVQSDSEIRAFAVLFDQSVAWRAWPSRHILSIDELEQLTGLDFLPGLDDPVEEMLEGQLPTRLLPTRFVDAFRMLFSHNN